MHIRSSFSITTILLSLTIPSPSLPPATTPSCRNYLETLLDLPWSHSTDDRLDVGRAKGDLDADHYGLEKVKKRVLEFLAVRQLKNTLKGRRSSIPPSLTPLPHPSPSSISPPHLTLGPILCFVGAPGVGKTSVGRSVAKTLGRKFHRYI